MSIIPHKETHIHTKWQQHDPFSIFFFPLHSAKALLFPVPALRGNERETELCILTDATLCRSQYTIHMLITDTKHAASSRAVVKLFHSRRFWYPLYLDARNAEKGAV